MFRLARPRHVRAAMVGLRIATALSLAACHTVPMTSLPALSRIDPFALDADVLRAVVVHEPTLQLPEGGAVMTLTLAKKDGSHTVREEFVLVPPSDETDVPVPAGQVVTALQVSPADRGRFERFQTLLNARRAARTKDNTFSLNIRLSPCITGEEEGTATAYIRAGQDGRYIKVGRGKELLAKVGADVGQCA